MAKCLTTFHLVMITVVSVDSIRNLSAAAIFGSQLIFFYTLAFLLFLIPSAIVSAELSGRMGCEHGVYSWVKQAFNKKMGLLAVWYQWVENIVFYPAILAFIAGSLSYLIDPALADNKYYVFVTVLILFWLMTMINLKGIHSSAIFSAFCTITGLIIPMILLMLLSGMWISLGKPLYLNVTWDTIIPPMQMQTWASLSAIILSLSGIEIATVHVNDVKNPGRSFPVALFYSTWIIVATLAGGSLAIAMVVPSEHINLLSGIMQTLYVYSDFLQVHHVHWVLPAVAIMLVLGGLGSVNNWIIAPTRGLLYAAKDNCMSAYFARENDQGAPTVLLWLQGIIVTLVASVFIFFPQVKSSYWYLNTLAVQLYLLMYMLMFVSYLVIRFKADKNLDEQRDAFYMPGGRWGASLISGAGLIGCISTFFVDFFPPQGTDLVHYIHYGWLIFAGMLVLSVPALCQCYVIAARERRSTQC